MFEVIENEFFGQKDSERQLKTSAYAWNTLIKKEFSLQ
jgi:hypothetical protein